MEEGGRGLSLDNGSTKVFTVDFFLFDRGFVVLMLYVEIIILFSHTATDC